MKNRRVWLLLVWVIATAVLVAAARRVNWTHALAVTAGAKPGWIALAVLANASILAWWAGYWKLLLPRTDGAVPYRRMLEIVSTASSVMNTVPFGAGHATGVVLLVKRGGASQSGALSVLALDQLGEGIAKIAICLLAGELLPLPDWMHAAVRAIAVAVALLLTVMIVLAPRVQALETLRTWHRAAGALVCVLLMKTAEGLAIAAVQQSFGVAVPAPGTVLVLAAVVLATALPLAPGNLGAYEAAVFLIYRYLGVPPDRALALAIVQHLCFMLPALGVGYLFVSTQTLARRAIASR